MGEDHFVPELRVPSVDSSQTGLTISVDEDRKNEIEWFPPIIPRRHEGAAFPYLYAERVPWSSL